MLTNIEYLILDMVLQAETESKKGLRPSEIKKVSKLTDPTLHKYLKKLVDSEYLIRQEVKRNREYPHPVIYRINENNEELRLLLDLPEEYRKGDIFLKISKRYVELSIAKEIIRECGINADAEIKKRYHERYGVKVEQTGEVFTFPLP